MSVTASSLDLVGPEEAVRIMSTRAGYEITTDDLRQMRRRGLVKAAQLLPRTTLYERSEIERASLPKKRHPKEIGAIGSNSRKPHMSMNTKDKAQLAYLNAELNLQIEAQKVELERHRLALEERWLALEERRLSLEEKRLNPMASE